MAVKSSLRVPSLLRRVSVSRALFLLLIVSLIIMMFATSFRAYERTTKFLRGQSDSGLGLGLGLHRSPNISKAESSPANLPSGDTASRCLPPARPQTCIFPPLQFNDPLMWSFVKLQKPIQCPSTLSEWVHVQNGTLVYSQEVIAKLGNFTCDVSPLIRPPRDDNRVQWGRKVTDFVSGGQIPSDFLKVECHLLPRPGGVISHDPPANPKPPVAPSHYTDVLMGVSPLNQKVWQRLKETKPPANGLGGLSVLMMGFDSMSRMSWLRRMKSTREYLVNRLGGIELEGYNIMGDGTPAALFPILTGRHEVEMPEARRRHRGARPVDDYPWIWKDFSNAGYVTSWADAEVNIAPFNYRLLGFAEPPTDYFVRPYYLGAKNTRKYPPHAANCRAGTPKHQDWFKWAHDIFRMYRDHPKFMMHFYATLSHENNNKITVADGDFQKFLEALETGGYLNSTILVVFGDHGARYDVLRATWAGRLEERLPYMTFRFPPWFERKYPQLMRNFRTNVHRLTTPMDIHETLHNVIKFDGVGQGDIKNRGISLFKEIPAERECTHADIRNHWCACLDWVQIKSPEADANAQRALQTALDFINNLTEPHRDLCARLEVKNVTSGQSLQAKEELLKFRKALDKDGRLPLLDERSKKGIREPLVLYQMSFTTKPGDGHFEVTVTQKGKATWKTSERDISRINKYGDAPSCILNINRQLRQYCYCRSLVNS